MPRLTDADLEALDALDAAATPGPWTAENGQLLAPDDSMPVLSCCNMDDLTLAFIARARTALPDLVADLREAQAALGQEAP